MKPLAKPGQTWQWGADLHPKWLNAFLRARKSLQDIPPTSQCHHLSKEPVVVQSFSPFQLFETPWTAAHQASLLLTNSQSLLKLMSIESVMPSNYLILFHPLLFPPSIFPSIRVFYNVSALCIRCRKYWSFSFSIRWNILMEYSNIFYWNIPMNIQGWFPLGWTGLISLQSKGLSRVFSNTTVWKHQFFGAQPSLCSNFHIHAWLLEKP